MKGTFNPPSSPARLTIAQRPEWNQFCDPNNEPSWSRPIGLFLLLTCPFVLLYLPLLELTYLDAWLRNKPMATLPETRVLWVMAVMAGIAAAFIEWDARRKRRSSKKMEITSDGIQFKDIYFIRWEDVEKLTVLPVASQDNLRNLIVRYELKLRGINISFLKRRRMHNWRIALEHPQQTEALRNELTAIRQAGRAVPELIESHEPSTKKRGQTSQLLIYVLGAALFFNGLPLFLIGDGMLKAPHSTPTPLTKREKQFNRILYTFFSSPREIGGAFVIGGEAMVGVGMGLCIYIMVLDTRRHKQTQKLGLNE